jgi:hypothetical protein
MPVTDRLLEHGERNRKEDGCDDCPRRGAHPRTDTCGMHPGGVMSRVLYFMSKRRSCGRPEEKDHSKDQRPGNRFQASRDHGCLM